jgi:hypothetical protein
MIQAMRDTQLQGAVENAAPSFVPPMFGMRVPIDMSDIYRVEAMFDEITRINSMNGPYYMQEFLKGKELASSYLCKLIFEYEQAKNQTKESYAIAYLEKAEEYLKLRNIKSTDEAKKQYVQIDEAYKKAKDKEDALKALMTLMSNKMDAIQSAHDDAKKVYDQSRDSRGAGITGPQGRTHE